MRPAIAILAALTALPGIAHAQQLGAVGGEASVYSHDYLIVGAGAVVMPSYEGSDDMVAIPAAGIAGRIGGIGISPRAAGVALDLWQDPAGATTGIVLGPSLRYRMNRKGRTHDPVVDLLGKLPGVIEGGVNAGLNFKHVITAADSLSASVDVRWDLSGHGSGTIVSPGFSYLTPISRSQIIGLAVTTDWTDARYARYNFSVTPAGSTASGLPVFTAKQGFNDASIGLFFAQDLDGNLLNGGFSVGGGIMYSHLFGSAADSPITRIRGSSGQWIGGIGLAYVFSLGGL